MTDTIPAVDTASAQDVQTFSLEYVQELRQENKARRLNEQSLQERLDTHKQAQDTAAAESLAEQGKYKTLSDNYADEIAMLKPYKTQIEQITESARISNAEFIKNTSEDMLWTIPEMEPLQLQQWINTNRGRLTGQTRTATTTNGGAGTSSKPIRTAVSLTPQEKAMADKFGISYEDYTANKR